MPDADPCSCGVPTARHDPPKARGARTARGRRPTRKERTFFVGVDGEGQGRSPHLYTLLAWSDRSRERADTVSNPKGLSTVECLDFLLEIPPYAKAFAYAFNYDLTKLLKDVDSATLYRLFRPELRQRRGKNRKLGPRPVSWGEYLLNLQGTKFTVIRGKARRVVWDVFKFFQSKFTSALEDWKVGTPAELAAMRAMKDQRAHFDRLSALKVEHYCLDECAKMAELAEKLVAAHEEVGLTLKNFYGAGSTGGAILKELRIDEETRTGPVRMTRAIASAFFGGRFENSVIGSVKGPLWSYDISSAYPYQTASLPCLGCGTWKKTRSRKAVDGAAAALVRYRLLPTKKRHPWGPFPFRLPDGSICFPSESGGGWVWRDEFVAGERLFPNVEFREAWVYTTACSHRPFRKIPEYYVHRLKIGKEGAGIVIKLGVNSVYGKLAQSVGEEPPFQSWIWAGIITSGTRAQILDALALTRRRASLLMVATDGICSRERLTLPEPRDTGTMTEHKKPLGGWEEKEIRKGVFFARPGIYFPLRPTADELKSVRARGVGRAVMLTAWKKLVSAWQRKKKTVPLAKVVRFIGAKSAISRAKGEDGEYVYNRSPFYGEWIERPIELSFSPLPKRERWRKDGTLVVRKRSQREESTPYARSLLSEEARLLRQLQRELEEQPDGGDYAEYEGEG